MHPTSIPIALKIYSICCVILFLKMVAIGFIQGGTKTKSKTFTNPEDAKVFKGNVSNELPDTLVRANNAFRNDLENIPMFLFLGLLYVILNCWDKGSLIYFSTFTFARVMHTVFYIKGIQPWRTLSYGIGLLMSMAISGHILYTVLT